MASKEMKKELHLRQVSTNEESSCEMEVTPEDFMDNEEDGAVLQMTSLQVIQENVENDTELTPQQRDKLRFVPEGETTTVTTQGGQPPVRIQKVVERLNDFAKATVQLIKNDPTIEEETKKIIAEAFRPQGSDETDSGEEVHFDVSIVCSHIQDVFRILIDDTLKPGASVMTILTQWGLGLAFCYYLVKRLVITYIERLTFKGVVEIICRVLSQLYTRLRDVQFGVLLKQIGGWNSIIAGAIVSGGTRYVANRLVERVPREYQFLGMGLASLGMGAMFIVAFVYLKFRR